MASRSVFCCARRSIKADPLAPFHSFSLLLSPVRSLQLIKLEVKGLCEKIESLHGGKRVDGLRADVASKIMLRVRLLATVRAALRTLSQAALAARLRARPVRDGGGDGGGDGGEDGDDMHMPAWWTPALDVALLRFAAAHGVRSWAAMAETDGYPFGARARAHGDGALSRPQLEARVVALSAALPPLQPTERARGRAPQIALPSSPLTTSPSCASSRSPSASASARKPLAKARPVQPKPRAKAKAQAQAQTQARSKAKPSPSPKQKRAQPRKPTPKPKAAGNKKGSILMFLRK